MAFWRSARANAGTCEDLLLVGEVDHAFCAVRPRSHVLYRFSSISSRGAELYKLKVSHSVRCT